MDERRDPGGGGFQRFGASRQAFRRGRGGFRRPPGTDPYVHPAAKKTVTFAPSPDAAAPMAEAAGDDGDRRQPPVRERAVAYRPTRRPSRGGGGGAGAPAPPHSRAGQSPATASAPVTVPMSVPASGGIGLLERRICDDVTAFTPLVLAVADEEAGCWLELSAMVRSRRAVGFPVCRRAQQCGAGAIPPPPGGGAVVMCFESFGAGAGAGPAGCAQMQLRAGERPCALSDAVVFQMVAIMYHLFQRGIFLDDVCVDLISVPPCSISFSVSQLVFQVSTSSLVVLSPRSRLYRARLPQACYMDLLRLLVPAGSRFLDEGCAYFFEWIIRHHLDLLSKHFLDMFRASRRSVSGTPLHRRAEPGVLVWVAREDAVVLGVTLTEVSISDNVRVIWSADGAVFEVEDFPVHDVFPAPELVTRARAMVCL